MKRTYTLLVLLGLVVGSLLTGCTPASETPKPDTTSTNAVPPPSTAPASTNK